MSTHTAVSRHFPILLCPFLLWCATSVAQGSKPQLNDPSARMTLKARLAQIVTTPPDVVQFSKDKKYEEAWIIKSSSARPSDDQRKRYLDKEKFEVLIVEYVWNSEDDDNRFVLTLFQDKRVKMRNPEEFLKTCLDLFYSKPDFLTLMNTLDAKVIGKPYLLQDPADEATIGIFNYWFSTGPVTLWKRGENYTEQTVRKKITARPTIEKTRLNFQALLFRFNVDGNYDGPFYGFKTPCCKRDGDLWIVDYAKTFYWMKFMLFDDQSKVSTSLPEQSDDRLGLNRRNISITPIDLPDAQFQGQRLTRSQSEPRTNPRSAIPALCQRPQAAGGVRCAYPALVQQRCRSVHARG